MSAPIYTAIACAAALTVAACASTERKADGICTLPTTDARSAAVANGNNPFSHDRMRAIDFQIARYVAQYPERTKGWQRPAKLPFYVVWDCAPGKWRKHVAHARHSGEMAMIYEMAVGNTAFVLAVAIHERAHQWQPQDTAATPEAEAAAKLAERTIMGSAPTLLAGI